MERPRYDVWIDRGGTFTDCLVRDRVAQSIRIAKVLSGEEDVPRALRQILGLSSETPLPSCHLRLGTTIGTNALLERRGAPTVLVVSEGFRDLLIIGDQTRPDLFELAIRQSDPLVPVVSVPSRGGPGGMVDRATDDQIATILEPCLAAGAVSCAVCLLFGHRCPELEEQVEEVARQLGFRHVELSHQVSVETGYLGRAQTTTINAYLTPLLRAYLRGLEGELAEGT
ncbi:MAG: hydantoinase/oxoprolinase N-terminal domain-containing protein, partial [Myxococcota bacterium]